MSDPTHIADIPASNETPSPSKQTTLDRCAAEIGKHRDTLLHWLRVAQWTPPQFHAAIKKRGWWEQLQHDAQERELDRRVAGVGPTGLIGITDELALSKMTPQLRKFVETYEGGSALLQAPTGAGKSLAAFLVLRRLKRAEARKELESKGRDWALYQPAEWYSTGTIERYRDGWISAGDLLTSQRCHRLGDEEAPEIRKAKTERLVVVDDVTWPQRDDVTRDVLATRYDAGLPTIVTAGATRKELYDRFRDALSRRFLEAGGVKGVVVDGFGEGNGK